MVITNQPGTVKGKVYKVAVTPAMLYGLETVVLTKRGGDEVAELKMLLLSLRVTIMDNIVNEYIRGTAQVEGLERNKRRKADVVWTCTEDI